MCFAKLNSFCSKAAKDEIISKVNCQLQILPKSLIYLRADEPNLPGTADCLNAVEDTSWVVPQHDPQEGFKGKNIGSHLFTIMCYIKQPYTPRLLFVYYTQKY